LGRTSGNINYYIPKDQKPISKDRTNSYLFCGTWGCNPIRDLGIKKSTLCSMKPIYFLRQLVLVSVVSIMVILALGQFAAVAPFIDLAWWSMVIFTLLNVVMYGWSYQISKNNQKHQFVNVFMSFTFFKLFSSFGLVAFYFFKTGPNSKLFVLPFFAIYLVYTIFEVYFMTKLSNSKIAIAKE